MRTVARERTTPSPLKAAPTGRPTPLVNAGTEEAPLAIDADAAARSPQFHQEKMLQFQLIFFNRYACSSFGAEGFKSG